MGSDILRVFVNVGDKHKWSLRSPASRIASSEVNAHLSIDLFAFFLIFGDRKTFDDV
jgi:hypothetical protein